MIVLNLYLHKDVFNFPKQVQIAISDGHSQLVFGEAISSLIIWMEL